MIDPTSLFDSNGRLKPEGRTAGTVAARARGIAAGVPLSACDWQTTSAEADAAWFLMGWIQASIRANDKDPDLAAKVSDLYALADLVRLGLDHYDITETAETGVLIPRHCLFAELRLAAQCHAEGRPMPFPERRHDPEWAVPGLPESAPSRPGGGVKLSDAGRAKVSQSRNAMLTKDDLEW